MSLCTKSVLLAASLASCEVHTVAQMNTRTIEAGGKTIKYVVLRCLTKCSYSQINFGKTLTFRETYGICADMCSDIKSPFKQCAGSAEGDLIDLQCVLWGSGRRPTGNMGTALMLDWDQVALRTL